MPSAFSTSVTADHWCPYRVLITGSRHWYWPKTVHAVLDRLHGRHGDNLVVIEGSATGADQAAHEWCLTHALSPERHRCHPVDWNEARRTRQDDWWRVGPERNTAMLAEQPDLIIAFHDSLDTRRGGTSDMILRGLLTEVPAWLVPGYHPMQGRWVSLDEFPDQRRNRVSRELAHTGTLF